jgi:hypothetical protein
LCLAIQKKREFIFSKESPKSFRNDFTPFSLFKEVDLGWLLGLTYSIGLEQFFTLMIV